MNPIFFAYIDPGAGAMILQILIAGILGVAFYFRRFFGALLSWTKKDRGQDIPTNTAPEKHQSDGKS